MEREWFIKIELPVHRETVFLNNQDQGFVEAGLSQQPGPDQT